MTRTSMFVLLVAMLGPTAPVATAVEPPLENPAKLANVAAEQPAAVANASPFARFVAEAGHDPPQSLAAWNEFRRVAGAKKPTRELFAAIAEAEPELCSAIGGNAKTLNDLFIKRRRALVQPLPEIVLAIRTVGPQIGPGELGAMLFIAARRDIVMDDAADAEIKKLLTQNEKALGLVVPSEHAPPREIRDLLRLWATQWVSRDADPTGIRTRWEAARELKLVDAYGQLALQILRHPEGAHRRGSDFLGELADEFAIVMVGKLGERQNVPLLARFLSNGRRLYCGPEDSQLRDLALGMIVHLNGGRPQDFSMQPYDGTPILLEHTRVYVFTSIEKRNTGFAQCVKQFKELGLDVPPTFSPGRVPLFAFRSVTPAIAKGLTPLHTTADGKVTLELHGNSALLIDVATGKQIGKELRAGTWQTPAQQFTFSCWSFSPDGKSVVTGSGFYLASKGGDSPENLGHVEVWDAASGALIETGTRRAGAFIPRSSVKTERPSDTNPNGTSTTFPDRLPPAHRVSESELVKDVAASIDTVFPASFVKKPPWPSSSTPPSRRSHAAGFSSGCGRC